MKVKVKYKKNRGGRVTMMESGYAKILVKIGVVDYVAPPAAAPSAAPVEEKKVSRKKKAAGEGSKKKTKKRRSRKKKKADALPIDAQ